MHRHPTISGVLVDSSINMTWNTNRNLEYFPPNFGIPSRQICIDTSELKESTNCAVKEWNRKNLIFAIVVMEEISRQNNASNKSSALHTWGRSQQRSKFDIYGRSKSRGKDVECHHCGKKGHLNVIVSNERKRNERARRQMIA